MSYADIKIVRHVHHLNVFWKFEVAFGSMRQLFYILYLYTFFDILRIQYEFGIKI